MAEDAQATPLSEAVISKDRSLFFCLGAFVCLVIFLGFSLANIFRLPPLCGPDEADHLAYVRILRTEHRPPVLPRFTTPNDPRCGEQAQHPPLYYVLLAMASYALPDLQTPAGQKALKGASVLIGLAGLLAFMRLARQLWPTDEITALLALAFLAWMPNYWTMTAHINNSAGSLMASSLVLWLLYQTLQAETSLLRRWLVVGVWTGLALLTKMTAAWLLAAVLAAQALQLRAKGWKQMRLAILATWAPIAMLVGIWMTYNFLSFGEFMPRRVLGREYLPYGFATIFFTPLAAPLLLYTMIVRGPLTALGPYWLMSSAIHPTRAWLLVIATLSPALFAAAWRGWQRASEIRAGRSPRLVFFFACACGLGGAALVALEAVLHDWQCGLYPGRYAVEALPALALLFAAGWRVLFPRNRVRAITAALWLGGLLAIGLFVHSYMASFFATK